MLSNIVGLVLLLLGTLFVSREVLAYVLYWLGYC
jgi:hypothetical protein